MSSQVDNLEVLLRKVRACKHCEANLPQGVRPVLQLGEQAKVLIAGQAPGAKVHASGVPFDDASGERLRDWMGVDKTTFYDKSKIAILPMGFCYPGTGKSGDLPPRKECTELWRREALDLMQNVQLVLVIGKYAIDWHLPKVRKNNLTDTVRAWKTHWPTHLPMPHPSPRNNIWLKKNSWFERDVLPSLKGRIQELIS